MNKIIFFVLFFVLFRRALQQLDIPQDSTHVKTISLKNNANLYSMLDKKFEDSKITKEMKNVNVEKKSNKKLELDDDEDNGDEYSNAKDELYEDALLEHTADGGYKVIPLNILKSLHNQKLYDQINKLKEMSKRTTRKIKYTDNNLAVGSSTCKSENLFETIMEELENIKNQRSNCGSHEGFACSINGSWISYVGDIRIDIQIDDTCIAINFSDSIPSRKGPFSGNWTAKGESPFPKGGLFSITAWSLETKQMATFIGQCRYCSFAETISGWWSFGREARDCRDLLSCVNVRADLIRKENAHKLRQYLDMDNKTKMNKIETNKNVKQVKGRKKKRKHKKQHLQEK